MKRILLTLMIAAGAAGGAGAIVSAETTPAPKTSTAAPARQAPGPAATAMTGGPGMMGGGMMGGGMMGGGMMGGGMMGGGMMGGGMCPMVGAAGTKVDVKKIDKGVTITYTSTDPATVTRLQKMAEAMRLMHEANSP